MRTDKQTEVTLVDRKIDRHLVIQLFHLFLHIHLVYEEVHNLKSAGRLRSVWIHDFSA